MQNSPIEPSHEAPPGPTAGQDKPNNTLQDNRWGTDSFAPNELLKASLPPTEVVRHVLREERARAASGDMPSANGQLTKDPARLSDPITEQAKSVKPSLFSRVIHDLGERLRRLPGQLFMRSPFSGSIEVERLPTIKSIFNSVTNFKNPLKIIDKAFKNGGDLSYLDIPGFGPILYVRDPEIIKDALFQTGQERGLERDGLETQGIGRIVGDENLLRAQGATWKKHKQAIAKPLSMGVVGSIEVYQEMEKIVRTQLGWLEGKVKEAGGMPVKQLEPEIKTAMLELLAKTMFGVNLPSEQFRDRYLPAIENVIDYILLDTVSNPLGVARLKFPAFTARRRALKESNRIFEELVDLAIEQRAKGGGFWRELKIPGTDEAIRSNVKVLLAGALEATASYVAWTVSSLSRNPAAQERARQEALLANGINEKARRASTYLQQCLDESLRLNAPLYLLPRTSKDAVTITTSKGTLNIPKGVHLILATYHAGRHEKYWGVERTGYPALDYVPERWDPDNMARHGMTEVNSMHFGFGHGARFCSGRNFAQVEAFIVMNLFLSSFKVTAVTDHTEACSGVSTRPADKVLTKIELAKPNTKGI